MAIKYDIPFPQANDFEKIIRIINITDANKLKDTAYMQDFLGGITSRQVEYYISAVKYLGCLDKGKQFTEAGERLREMDICSQKAELIRLIISDKVMGSAYITGKIVGEPLSTEEIESMIRIDYPGYSDEIYKRRAESTSSWLSWIDSQLM